jgi:hypothetical protein
VFVAGLTGMGIEAGGGEAVHLLVMHGDEDLAGSHGGSDQDVGDEVGATRLDADLSGHPESETTGVVGMDLHVALGGVELAEDGGFAGAGVGVPLGAGAASGEQDEGVVGVGGFGDRAWEIKKKAGPSIRSGEPAILEESSFLDGVQCGGGGGRELMAQCGGEWPLNTAGKIEEAVVIDAGDGIGAGTGFADLPGHEGEVDDGLGEAVEEGEIGHGKEWHMEGCEPLANN